MFNFVLKSNNISNLKEFNSINEKNSSYAFGNVLVKNDVIKTENLEQILCIGKSAVAWSVVSENGILTHYNLTEPNGALLSKCRS